MRAAHFSLALSALSLSIVACGEPVDAGDAGDAQLEVSAAAPGLTAISRLPEAGPMMDNQPANFNAERGWSEYRTEDGRRDLFLTTGDSDADLAAQKSAPSSLIDLLPNKDTWSTYSSSGARIDYGRSCELQVNNQNLLSVKPKQTLIQFNIPTTVTCSTISSARLILKTADLTPAAPIRVSTFMLTSAFTPGATGLSTCSSCNVDSGQPAGFLFPTSSVQGGTTPVSKACTSYVFDITQMAKDWCATPTRNFGVLVAGIDSTSTANFHSMESPLVSDRPTLEIVY